MVKKQILNCWILLFFIVIKFILQFAFVNPVYELHRDEFLYLDQAFHPAAGYISVPPLTSWISGIIFLLGGGIFWVRFFPALFGAVTLVFACLIVEELGGKRYAQVLTAVLLIFSVFTRMNVLFQPNSFDILAWTALFYFLIKYIRTRQTKWLMCLSGTAVLGMYNKYTIAILLAGLLIGLSVCRERLIFRKKEFYFSIKMTNVDFFLASVKDPSATWVGPSP